MLIICMAKVITRHFTTKEEYNWWQISTFLASPSFCLHSYLYSLAQDMVSAHIPDASPNKSFTCHMVQG